MENGRKTPEELANLKHTIRRGVDQKLRPTVSETETDFTASFEVEDPSSGGQRLIQDPIRERSAGDDDFWSLGRPKPRVYKKPDFTDAPVEMTDVSDTVESVQSTIGSEKIDRSARTAADLSEKNPVRGIHSRLNYRPADNTDLIGDAFDDLSRASEDSRERPHTTTSTAITAEGRQTIVHDAPPRYATSSYKRQSGFHPPKTPQEAERLERRKRSAGNELLARYQGNGLLLREVEVRSWTSDIDFYERFMENAEKSHAAAPSVPYTVEYPPIKYFSYVPQYAHMSRAQLDFYLWIRENIRHGRYPDCDSSYIQLYIYEILNLPERIPPEIGAAQLAGIWLHYRRTEPRLDGYLCEWLPDYCMIHHCPLPEKLKPILPEIVPKAQFKEFYFDIASETSTQEDFLVLAKILIEASSDYDYRRSRYYSDNRAAYEEHLPRAVSSVIARAITDGKGVFSREKTYKMARDSYCGAIVSIDVKRRLNIEFRSFTRSADTRHAVTAIVKYTENKLRLTLGIKAKLGVDGITPEDSAAIDAYFAPMMPQKPVKAKEDRYMPEDYLKHYESEDSGFDFGAAAEIERMSWQNTTLLTRGEFEDVPENVPQTEEIPDIPAPSEEKPEKHPVENIAVSETPEAPSADTEPSDGDSFLKEALSAALRGQFHDFCRDHQIYDGVLADRINTRFLDLIDDIVLEENGKTYVIIEDYMEDIESWMEE